MIKKIKVKRIRIWKTLKYSELKSFYLALEEEHIEDLSLKLESIQYSNLGTQTPAEMRVCLGSCWIFYCYRGSRLEDKYSECCVEVGLT